MADEGPPKSSKTKARCEVCTSAEAKYTCPRCAIRTCSLPCVKQHKTESQCNGQRDKTAFIALSEFTERDLCSDLHFMEDMRRGVEVSKKDSQKYEPKDHSRRVKALTANARQRGVYIAQMPKGMSRHCQNTTMYHFQSKTIHWRVEWIFPEENLSFVDDRFPDVQLLQDGVDSHIQKHHEQLPSASLERQGTPSLKQYTAEGGRQYHAFLKVYGQNKYYELDKTQSLHSNFTGKCIVEFPTVYLVTDQTSQNYPVLSAEEENGVMSAAKNKNRRQHQYHHTFRRGQRRGGQQRRPQNKDSDTYKSDSKMFSS